MIIWDTAYEKEVYLFSLFLHSQQNQLFEALWEGNASDIQATPPFPVAFFNRCWVLMLFSG